MRELCWYAVSVRHQHERQVAGALESNGVETFAPFYWTRRRWSDRVKELELPLFPGYVFGRFAVPERMRVLRTPGVTRIVDFGGLPARIEEGEIASIKTAMESKLAMSPWPHLRVGDRVRISEGPLRGVEGLMLREKGSLRVVIGIELLQRSIAVELEPEMVIAVGA